MCGTARATPISRMVVRVKYSESSEPGITTCVLINTSFIAYFSVPNMQYELTADLILRKPIIWLGRGSIHQHWGARRAWHCRWPPQMTGEPSLCPSLTACPKGGSHKSDWSSSRTHELGQVCWVAGGQDSACSKVLHRSVELSFPF